MAFLPKLIRRRPEYAVMRETDTKDWLLIFENSYLFFKTAHVESHYITLEFIAGFHSISV